MLLTVKQVAERLNCHTETVLRRIRAGELEAIRIGNGYRISEEGLARFIERQAVGVQS